MGIKTLPEFIAFGVLFGFFVGTYITMSGPLMAMLTDDFSELGPRMGVAFAFMALGGLVGGPINGALLGDGLMWWRASVVSGASFLILWFLKLQGSDN
ncbi:hypothetical protein K435DRAFT_773285 [Dendrothele bispora CBS 962.96]|uniref:Major facilitator superfamily (MFS) profile domain-containing protein n=1 Tax=Dendrothele bispora (strain CBS 962.96) TaxID=1314807 RepID=A0A4V6T5Q4_DENBC|nr:hypothetical protein K435DRAFT_773285 [Dendrothele bispora CBS 962.96]